MSARDVEKDFYKLLGVSQDADASAIKKAYRRLAREFHPDANKGDAAAEERFKEISEAYDVLSDPKRRAEYDEMRTLFAQGGYPRAGSSQNANFQGFDINDLFGGGGGDFLGDLFGGRSRGPRRGADLTTDVEISFHDALFGAEIPLHLSQQGACQTCHGSGAKPGTTPRTCSTCGGAGQVSRNAGGFAFPEPCRDCRGRGVHIDTPCAQCRGTGQEMRTRTITARIPAGINDGARIRLKGKGGAGGANAPAGDLLVTVHVKAHPLFGRKDHHVTITVPVTFAEATLGADIEVPAPDGSVVKVRLAPGTANGRVLRVKGRGVPHKGDLLVTVDIAVPQRLDNHEREALEKFAAASAHHNPREAMMKKAGA